MNIIVGFSKPKKFKPGAEFIKLWQGTNYSHVYVRFDLKWLERQLIFQASHGMVHGCTVEHFLTSNEIVSEFQVARTDQQIKETIQTCFDLQGRPYGYFGLIVLGLKKIFPKLKIVGDGRKSMHCSEFAACLFSEKFGEDCDYVEPVDVFKFLWNESNATRIK